MATCSTISFINKKYTDNKKKKRKVKRRDNGYM